MHYVRSTTNYARSTTRWLAVFILNAAVLLLPIFSIPTCCCATSNIVAGAGGCCCSVHKAAGESRCCCATTSRQSSCCDESSTESSCDRRCRCGDLIAPQAIGESSRKVKQVEYQTVTLLDWSSVPTGIDWSRVRSAESISQALSHNVRQSLLAVWLK